MKYLFLFLLLLAASLLKAQEIEYYTQFFSFKTGEKTEYFRTYETMPFGCLVKEYEKGALRYSLEIERSCEKDTLSQFLVFMKNNEYPIHARPYFQGINARLKQINENGFVVDLNYDGQKLRYAQSFDPSGKPLLTEGSGTFVMKKKDVNEYETYVVNDSILYSAILVRPEKNDTIYSVFQEWAAPYEGINEFYSSLIRKLKYPLLQRMAGTDGAAFIEFVVAKDGVLSEFRSAGEQPTAFDAKTIQALSKLPPWKPAIFEGKAVKSQMVLPIIFKLR